MVVVTALITGIVSIRPGKVAINFPGKTLQFRKEVSGFGIELYTRRSLDDPVFQHVRQGNTSILKQLFDLRTASPDDRDIHGRSLLWVCTWPYLHVVLGLRPSQHAVHCCQPDVVRFLIFNIYKDDQM